jgi:hypothetical protein
MALWPCCFFHSWVRPWTDGLFDDDFLMVPRWCPVGVCTMVNHRRPADWRGGGWRTIPKFVACGGSCSTAVDGWGDDVCVVRLSPPCVSLKEDQDPLTKRMIMGLWTYFNRLQQGLQPPVEGCRRNPQNSSLWMTMPRCLVLNGNGTCVKTGVISVAYASKMSHWVQISRPSNHGLDVVSHPIWKGVQHIVIIHYLYPTFGCWNPISFGWRLARAKVSAIAPCIPLVLQLGTAGD